jgi:UDPglucose 6-dehydrogenase
MKIGIVGLGVVGKHVLADVGRAGIKAVGYDIAVNSDSVRDEINTCDAAFVCVGTPEGWDGSCDLSAIDDVFSWLHVRVAIIRSTIPPGTTDRLQSKYAGYVVFVPEFIGEGVNAPYNQMRQPPFVIVGGDRASRHAAIQVLSLLYNSECEMIGIDADAAELAKYSENYFLALKVTWANELFLICNKLGIDFDAMMNAVTHDYRIGRSHTHVHADAPGWSGRCLPKDTAALLALVGEGNAPLLAALRKVNALHRDKDA